MKIRLRDAVRLLRESGVDSPEHDARELFVSFGGYSRHLPPLLSDEAEGEALREALMRRAAREPLQYIIGEAAFYNEVYTVSPAVLIPRSDTEILVETAIKRLPSGARFLDLCSGSGCVGISTLCNTSDGYCIAADISETALELARSNAERNGVAARYTAIRQDVLSAPVEEILRSAPFDAVLSNPPYIKDSVIAELSPEVKSEPRIALAGGCDGGDFYRAITPVYKELLSAGGFIAYEIGFDQAELLREIAEENRMNTEIIRDLSGNPRVALLCRHS